MRLRACIISILALFLTLPASAAEPTPVIVSEEIRLELASSSTARVLIYLQTPSLESASLGQRIAAVGAAQESLLASLLAPDFTEHRRFRAIPAIAGEITKRGLDVVARLPHVIRVDLDAGGSGGLAQSVPQIGADQLHAGGTTGSGITVAILDSGIDTDHLDLQDNLIDEACFCPLCCPDGGTTQFGPGAAEDDNGHGTHVSGIVTSGGIVAPPGVAPDASILAVKVLNAENRFLASSDIVAALDWILTDRPDVDVINMSLGTDALFGGDCDGRTAFTRAFADVINLLRNRGTIAVAASLNSGLTAMTAPACVASAISVGAVYDTDVGFQDWGICMDPTTAADQVVCFSNSSHTMDLVAPGALITSDSRFGGTLTISGTSMASPHVAGCVALLKQAHPTWDPDTIEEAMEGTGPLVTDPKNGLVFPRVDCAAASAAEARILHDNHLVMDDLTGNNDGIADPGDLFRLRVDLRNLGAIAAAGVSAVLSTATPGVIVHDSTAVWTDMPAFSVGSSSPPHFEVELDGGVPCGSLVDFTLGISSSRGPFVSDFSMEVGRKQSGSWLSEDTPLAIPEPQPQGVVSSVLIPESFVIAEITATVDITHTAIGDLEVDLTSPTGTVVRLHDRTGGTTDDLITTYDTLTVADGPGSMSDFLGEDVAGTWTLKVTDRTNGESGTLNSWSLAAVEPPACSPVPCQVTALATATPATVCAGNGALLADAGSRQNGSDCSGVLELRFSEGATVIQDWSTDADVEVFPATNTTYSMRARDQSTLTEDATFMAVSVLPVPVPGVVQIPDPVCVELPLMELDAGPGFASYTWRDDLDQVLGGAQVLSLDPQVACGRLYTVEVSNAEGCSDSTGHTVSCVACMPPEVSAQGSPVPLRLGVDPAGAIEFELLPDTDVTYSLYNVSSIAAMLSGDWTYRFCDLENNTLGTWTPIDATTVRWTPVSPAILFEGFWVVVADRLAVEGPYGVTSSGSPRAVDLDGSGSAASLGCP